MDLRQFGIDERILEGAPGLADQAVIHEKMLSQAVVKGENVCARIVMEEGREAVWLLPAIQWLAATPAGERRRALAVLPDRDSARLAAGTANGLTAALGVKAAQLGDGGEPALLAATLEELLAASAEGRVELRDFGYLLVDRGEKLAELPSEDLRRLMAALRPAWERRTVFACTKLSAKAKNLAWDLSENPVEVHIEETAARAQALSQESWHIASDRKLRFLLGLLARRKPTRTCVFCNLKSAAEELALRLRHNGLEAEYILGSLPPARKLAALGEVEAEPGAVLVLTDEAAAGLPAGRFPLVVNYDLPLDPELYLTRLALLDGKASGCHVVNLACDRYIYGLPAIESRIASSLGARPVDEELLKAEDRSEGLVYQMPNRERDGQGPGSRAGHLVPASRGTEPGRPAWDERRERHEGHGRDRDRGREVRPDRSPDIRKSISELTGGNLTSCGNLVESLGPSSKGRQPGKEERRMGGGPREASPEGRNAGQNSRVSSPKGRQPGKAPEGGKSGPGRGAPGQPVRRGPPSGAKSVANPYSLSSEERMQAYREKYGSRGNRSAAAPLSVKPGPSRPKEPRKTADSGMQDMRSQGGLPSKVRQDPAVVDSDKGFIDKVLRKFLPQKGNKG